MDRHETFEKLNGVAENDGDVFACLRSFPMEVVADVMLNIPENYVSARNTLPRMASDEVQDHWTGNHGHTLLFQSCAFVRSLEAGYLKYAEKRLEDKVILDYGCGWGRLIRLMYKYTAPENIFGCDPWQKSLDLCREAGIKSNLALCDYLPNKIPFDHKKFDLIYAFSVFTHLSEDTAKTVLSACRKSISDDGLLAITIRPASYWEVQTLKIDTKSMIELHRSNRYAFTPHAPVDYTNVKDADGLNTYGDASFNTDYIASNWKEWEIVGTDVSLLDAYQTVVFLKPKN